MSALRPPRIRPLLWSFVNACTSFYARLRFRIRLVATTNRPQTGVIVCAKHAGAVDIPILSDAVRRLTARRPYFQMGSFIGYPVLGLLRPLLLRLGGFCVMRPKEVRRLSRGRGMDRESALARMRVVNDQAEQIRQAILSQGESLVVFPEGTRDAARVGPLVSQLEIRSALSVAARGTQVEVWPVTISISPKRFLRRYALVAFHDPFLLDPALEPPEVLTRIADIFAEEWVPPSGVAARMG